MPDQPTRPGTMASIAGEPTRLTFHHLDAAAGTLHLRMVVRGSPALDRLRRSMDAGRVEIVLPDDDHIWVATPDRLDIASTGTGQTAFHRADLHFRVPAEASSAAASDPEHSSDTGDTEIGPPGPDPADISARLDRIEARLDRILTLLETRATNEP